MDSQLFTLSKIFSERLFRIPDYQRGYAWTEPQWADFWNDIQQIDDGGNHYTGVLTLESVPHNVMSGWPEDLWIIENKGYEPFYIVDGQQRLTTAIILIQAIIERVGECGQLNYTTPEEIRKKFIFESKDRGISRSYIFGYEKDNPSYEFLKTIIFGEFSSTCKYEETVYTNNLETAKNYFKNKIEKLSSEEIEALYKKITQQLLFNIFTISEEIDVCVAFETMNNRGRPLSYLELLKNRLIYLSLKLDEPDYEKSELRVAINECWKSIYHNLGRNKEKPLDDDLFLGVHYILYFVRNNKDDDGPESGSARRGYGRKIWMDGDHYTQLLGEIFVSSKINSSDVDSKISLIKIYDYVRSLQISVEYWYQIFNSNTIPKDLSFGPWLDKIERLNRPEFLTLVLSVLLKVKNDQEKTSILKAIERYIVILGLIDHSVYFIPSNNFTEDAIQLYDGKISPKQLASRINDESTKMTSNPSYLPGVIEAFRSRGFYSWPLLRYFLYEYNL